MLYQLFWLFWPFVSGLVPEVAATAVRLGQYRTAACCTGRCAWFTALPAA